MVVMEEPVGCVPPQDDVVGAAAAAAAAAAVEEEAAAAAAMVAAASAASAANSGEDPSSSPDIHAAASASKPPWYDTTAEAEAAVAAAGSPAPPPFPTYFSQVAAFNGKNKKTSISIPCHQRKSQFFIRRRSPIRGKGIPSLASPFLLLLRPLLLLLRPVPHRLHVGKRLRHPRLLLLFPALLLLLRLSPHPSHGPDEAEPDRSHPGAAKQRRRLPRGRWSSLHPSSLSLLVVGAPLLRPPARHFVVGAGRATRRRPGPHDLAGGLPGRRRGFLRGIGGGGGGGGRIQEDPAGRYDGLHWPPTPFLLLLLLNVEPPFLDHLLFLHRLPLLCEPRWGLQHLHGRERRRRRRRCCLLPRLVQSPLRLLLHHRHLLRQDPPAFQAQGKDQSKRR